MQNEQCGICWNLKFDKKGKKTHIIENQPHDFAPMDYCLKCKNPKYDQFGVFTHPDTIGDIKMKQQIITDHIFISGNENKYQRKRQKQKRILLLTGIGLLVGMTFVGLTSFIF